MKRLLIALLLTISMSGFAQQLVSTNFRTRISDDEQNLSIQIDGIQNGRKIKYGQTVAVAGMSTLRKEVLIYRAFNSVGIVPPLNEIPWLFVTGVGLLVLSIALLRVSFRSVRAALMDPVKPLRSE